MAVTRIADIIEPTVFNPYVQNRTMELSALVQSGIVSNNRELDRLAASGGRMINMPFWEDISGEDQLLSDSGALVPKKINANQDVAVLFMRGDAWSVNDLSEALSGDDPMARIGDLVAAYWARRRQALLISMLRGVFASPSMADNLHDITGEAESSFTGETFLDALQKLGDADSMLTAMVVHSATRTSMRKQDLIEFLPDSEGNPSLPTYMGKRIIVDDGAPYEDVDDGSGTGATVRQFTSYIFGQGAIGWGNAGAPVPTETDRDSLAGDDYLVNRTHFVMHPRGVRWNGASVAGSSPSNAEVADPANWTAVYEPKQIRCVAFRHTLA